MVTTLPARGMLSTDTSVGSLLLTIGRRRVFHRGGTVIGTQALWLHKDAIGLRIPGDDLAWTGDIDSVQSQWLSLALPKTATRLAAR